ncbi:5-formyltetrahydrofolate cyclo-ligase protein [Rutstroemia sp. NJR-2017a BVV2]|nr:5-formyltetrahydrofolate cyclo-ligase protein [Rutstroemia sp. NJR-2017a BVV2]
MKSKLSSITNESIQAQSVAVLQSLINFEPYQKASRIGIYLAMPTGEVQTDSIVRHALDTGKQVFVPYLYKSTSQTPDTPRSIMDMVDLRSLADFESLKRDSWGIPTIATETVDERESILERAPKGAGLDMILMPGVAFDVDPKTNFIRRLGHGKGFYDYFLHRYVLQQGSQVMDRSSGPGTNALLYGLALEEQFLQPGSGLAIPVGEHDSLLHGLLVGDGKIRGGLASHK